LNGIGNIAGKLAAKTNAVMSAQKRTAPMLLGRGISATSQPPAYFNKCHAFQAGSLGNFPYYWCDPNNLRFNLKTYKWISAGLKSNTSVVQLDRPFTNDYVQALSKVSYSLSLEDQARLEHARLNVLKQQGYLIKAWKDAFSEIPARAADAQPIDTIISIITQTWASPPTTFEQLQHSHDLNGLLNMTPASGISILPALVNYLNAVQSSYSLVNAATMSNGYVQNALNAAQYPASCNGAIETTDGLMRPAYVVSTPLEDILDGLNSTDKDRILTFKMSVVRSSLTECLVGMNSSVQDRVPIADFLNILTDDGKDLFSDKILTSPEPAEIEVTFMGLTTVYFGPAEFSQTTQKGWYWISPIKNAIENEGKDVSGFKFSPKPQIDFTKCGPFAFLTGVTISKKATLMIKSKSTLYDDIANTIKQLPSAQLKFLGMPVGADVVESGGHEINVTKHDEDESVAINLNPSQQILRDSLESTAFVLCVHTHYPLSE